MLNALVVGVVGLLAGAVLGIVMGFAMASHTDVLMGVRPKTNNRFIKFIARPTAELTFLEGAAFLVIMALWLLVFFGLVLAPAFVSARLLGDESFLLLGIACQGASWWLGQKFGAHLWRKLT